MPDERKDTREPRELSITFTAGEYSVLVRETGEALGVQSDLAAASKDTEGRIVSFLSEDWEEIAGFLSVQANRTRDKKRQQELDGLIEKIEDAILLEEERLDPSGLD
ncbi:MAG: hypothetical protein P8018_08525 [Acidobacteriota bacterium]